MLWKIGLFDFDGTDASAKIVSASIALVSALFGSVISIIGLILKYSLDQRNMEIREEIKTAMELILKTLLLAFQKVGNLRHPRNIVDIENIRVVVDTSSEAIIAYRDLVGDLEQWVKKEKTGMSRRFSA